MILSALGRALCDPLGSYPTFVEGVLGFIDIAVTKSWRRLCDLDPPWPLFVTTKRIFQPIFIQNLNDSFLISVIMAPLRLNLSKSYGTQTYFPFYFRGKCSFFCPFLSQDTLSDVDS